MDIGQLLDKALQAPRNLDARELEWLLASSSHIDERLFAAARELKARLGKSATLPRGLIETGNVCARNCLYCGIRRGNAAVRRYRMSEREILAGVAEAVRRGYPAVAFQSGEIECEENTQFYERLLRKLPEGVEVTLSLGEQTEEVYRRWMDAAGGRVLRYLIRIESSDRGLFAAIHPPDASYDRRLECIRTLKRLGYVTGSGVMIGLPGQTLRELARDIVFFGDEHLDMVGMGPYIPHPETPLADAGKPAFDIPRFEIALRMIALVRLYLHDVNIVAATALEAMDPQGRERGLAAGANVVMPHLTPIGYRSDYELYPGIDR